MKMKQVSAPRRRVAAIHDISGFGKCSLTVALPILSAAGIETACMPTAVLSTHTGDFEGFTYRDLTSDLTPFGEHWASLGMRFNAIYTGFLGSPDQAAVISRFIDRFQDGKTLVCVDPAMADGGKLYKVFDEGMIPAMRSLSAKADVLMPNMTEAAFLLDTPYREGPYEPGMIARMAKALSALGPRQVVLTGVYFDEKQLGCACYDAKTDEVTMVLGKHIPKHFHGTGDVFASFLIAALLNGYDLKAAADFAVTLTRESIEATVAIGTDPREGVAFEDVLSRMMTMLAEKRSA